MAKIHISKLIKFILDKANKELGRKYIRDKQTIKQALQDLVNSQDFKNTKAIFEYGTAVGGVVVFIVQLYEPGISKQDFERLESRFLSFEQLLEERFQQLGLVPEKTSDINTELVEPVNEGTETLEEEKQLKEENLRLKKKLEELENENTISRNRVISVVIVVGFLSLIFAKPSQAMEIIEQIK